MRLLAAFLTPLLLLAQTPSISNLIPVTPSTSKTALLTVGGEQLMLIGSNFGPTGAALSYIGPSPFQNGFTIRYSPVITLQNDTNIIFRTTPGIGANLQFTVTRSSNSATYTSPALASYVIPTIRNISGPTYALKPTGGDTIQLYGSNFGPRTYPGYANIYTPTVRFGGSAGTYGWMYSCTRGVADFDSVMTCRVPVGGGTNHSVRIQSGVTGQWSVANANVTVSYVTPTVLSTSPTFASMTTAGGDQIVIRGQNMPYPSWVINGLCPVSASFGIYNSSYTVGQDRYGSDLPGMPIKLANTSSPSACASLCALNNACKSWSINSCSTTFNCWLKGGIPSLQPNACITSGVMPSPPFSYQMKSCTGAFDSDGKTPVVTCLSPVGSGRGFALSTVVGNQYTNLLLGQQIGYAPPVIYDFAGASQLALTLGNQTVLINGRNFGNNSALVSATYSLSLKNPVSNIANYTYISPFCNITVPHTQLGCITAPGVGADLIWSVTVNSQLNVNPKTSYMAPLVTGLLVRNATTLQQKSGAATLGGDLLYIIGEGFGPPQLNLISEVYIQSSYGLIQPLFNYTLVSDSLVTALLPSGGGQGWQVSLKVADIPNLPSTANFSYADPTVLGVTPVHGPTIGGTVVTVTVRDLAINSNLVTAAVFGNPTDGSLYPLLLPTQLVPKSDNTSTGNPYLPDRLTFVTPSGAGAGRAIRLVTYLTTDQGPDVSTVAAPTQVGFSYDDPIIQNIVLAQPVTPQELQTATNLFGTLDQVRILTVFGINFGAGASSLASRDVQIYNNTWLNNTDLFRYDLNDWTDVTVKIYTQVQQGTIRIVLGSYDFTGALFFQISNGLSYSQLSPIILTNSTTLMPTIGGQALTISASYLAAASSLNLTVGGRPATIIDPSSGQPLNPSDIYTHIITNPAVYSPPGPFTSETVWTFALIVPTGQGSQVPVLLTRLPDGAVSAPLQIGYQGPLIATVNGAIYNPYQRVISPTPGMTLLITGSNFGPCPSIQIATYTITCIDQPSLVSADQTQITLSVPPGEGLGLDLAAAGWQIETAAGDQLAQPILFGWAAPVLQTVQADTYPTIGGTQLTLSGSNFGASIPTYPQAVLPANLQIQVILNGTQQALYCQSPQRNSHTEITCILPPGAGQLAVWLSVAGQLSTMSLPLTYNRPAFDNTTLNTTLLVGTQVAITGRDFGPSAAFSCLFLSNRRIIQQPICNGQEDFAGEGEQLPPLFWNHTYILFTVPPGTGSPLLSLSVWGQANLPTVANIVYPPPILTNISVTSGSADGGYPITLIGSGLGYLNPPLQYPLPLPPPPYYSPIRIRMSELCLSALATPNCITAVTDYQGTSATFLMPAGIGAGFNFTVEIDDLTLLFPSNMLRLWRYDPPKITLFRPNPLYIGAVKTPSVIAQGQNFGSPQAFINFPSADHSIAVYIDGIQQTDALRLSLTDTTGIQFTVDGTILTAGPKTTQLVVAQQAGRSLNTTFTALTLYCERDFFANAGELCMACPQGGLCAGGLSYPSATAGYFNLNSSYPLAEPCPSSNQVFNRDGTTRDLCLVACAPAAACVGNNRCATGYISTSPAYRCNSCDKSYYKRADECIRCPDSPIMVIIGCLLIVMFLAGVGFFLNKYNVNMAFLSIAIDYFQVVSIFLQTKIAWPPVIKNLMYVLSAFNLNLDIVAPECLVPDVSYEQKFYFIQGLPLALFSLLLLANVVYILYKAIVLQRTKKDLMKHTSAIKGAGIIIMYFLYLYLSRTVLDIFNCSPTTPPSYDSAGKIITYLSVAFEVCGKAGGLQARLTPAAVIGLIIYTLGFPVAIGLILWKNRIEIMYDQMLRAQSSGTTRFSNPVAYDIRKAYSRLYYQYKPDFYWWSLMILGRKFFIAITAVLFATNPAFQMAACLLVLFISYALQTRFNPFMCYSDYNDVLLSHQEAMNWSAAHRQIHAMLSSLDMQNTRKKMVRRNIMSTTGIIDKKVLFETMGSWIFNYNTVESVMLFSGVIICLMSVMYQSQNVAAGYDTTGRDIITGIIMCSLISSILYLATVFGVEIYISMGSHKPTQKLLKASAAAEASTRRLTKAIDADKDSTEMNPLMLRTKLSDQFNIEDFTDPPSKEIWVIFRDLFKEQHERIDTLNKSVSVLKKESQIHKLSEIELTPSRHLSVYRKEFRSPTTIREER